MQVAMAVKWLVPQVSVATISDEEKARVIVEFGNRLAEEVLLRAGYTDPDVGPVDDVDAREKWNSNLIFYDLEGDMPGDGYPSDCFHEIWLQNIPATLDIVGGEDPPIAHRLMFGKGRVVEWNNKRNRIQRVMTYEEAARYVILWSAEKILQITRKNRWDEPQMLSTLELFDRMSKFLM